ncbi:hypothetical protein [Phytohabitans suffuscus]|uniref:Uncharacterized protein n=1 Tax=Phytohabitans suffuscus TaxID=624315 RepID=A0A6F8YXZ5_9ACTN|nr:hypothetical protein [Phytohabitans suffuscus]BCB91045.1 hypothetical protein Psuf_083580 [Phytohabitans suffuscus]
MPSPDYLPLALHLPAVYQEDQESFAQLDSYLGLADDLARAALSTMEDVEHWLSPEGGSLWPPGLPLDAGAPAVLEAYRALYDELAAWFAFRAPVTWAADPGGLALRRRFLRTAARVWRRRATPRGLVDWFCLAFEVAPADRPLLVEHFRVTDPDASDVDTLDPWLRATAFVPATDQFADFTRRRAAIAFVDRYAPAHVQVRVCWTKPGAFDLDPVPGPQADPAAVARWRARVRQILCDLVSFVDHANGIRVWECVDEGRAIDRLGVGRLPGGGVTP